MIKTELQVHQREAYEKYINSLINAPKDEKALTNSLRDFVEGSDIHDFLYLLTQQKLTNGNLSEKDKILLRNFTESRRQGYQELATR
jgi:hypothetical protein